MKPHIKVFFFYGLFMWLSLLLITWTEWGDPAWVVQQVIIFFVGLGVLPGASKLPLIRGIVDDINQLKEFYARNPQSLRVGVLLYRHIPIINFFLLRKEFQVMLRIIILSVPLDLALGVLTNYVLSVPSWGLTANFTFLQSFLFESAWTFIVTPYLVMILIGIKWFTSGPKTEAQQSA